jgi:uncharacterized RDD family membrane protein YckC
MICTNHVDIADGVRRCYRCGRPYCANCLVSLQGQLYCGICKGERVLDVRSGTEQGVLRLAGAGRRFAALTLDRLIMALGVGIMAAVAVGLGSVLKIDSDTSGMYIFAGLGVGLLAFVALEAVLLTRRGQTLGKMAASIKVVRPDGSAIHAGQAWGRTIARLMAVHVLALADYIPGLVTTEKTCLHDLIANTRVVSID